VRCQVFDNYSLHYSNNSICTPHLTTGRKVILAKLFVVTQVKGGGGKTTYQRCIGTGLALRGFKTVIVDFDLACVILDLIMGCERRVFMTSLNS